jgi:hypothetical protein
LYLCFCFLILYFFFLLILTEVGTKCRGSARALAGQGGGLGSGRGGTGLGRVRARRRPPKFRLVAGRAGARAMGSLYGRAALWGLLCRPRAPGPRLLVRPSSGESGARGEAGGGRPRGLCCRTCGDRPGMGLARGTGPCQPHLTRPPESGGQRALEQKKAKGQAAT